MNNIIKNGTRKDRHTSCAAMNPFFITCIFFFTIFISSCAHIPAMELASVKSNISNIVSIDLFDHDIKISNNSDSSALLVFLNNVSMEQPQLKTGQMKGFTFLSIRLEDGSKYRLEFHQNQLRYDFDHYYVYSRNIESELKAIITNHNLDRPQTSVFSGGKERVPKK